MSDYSDGLLAPSETAALSLPEAPERAAVEPEPAAAVRTYALRVRTVGSYARDAARVPGVAFQVFPRCEQVPAVRRGSLLPPIPLAPGDPAICAGRTGADGEARLELEPAGLRLGEDGLPLVCVRVVAPGHRQEVHAGRAAKDEPGLLEAVLVAAPGATARVRVVDATGTPVSADVRLHRWIAPSGTRHLVSAETARALCDGWFELHVKDPAVDAALLVDAGDLGTGALEDVDIPLDAPPQDLRVVVHGAGSLRGRVLDTTGAPAAGVELQVVLASLDRPGGSLPEPANSLRRIEGLGRVHGMLTTDSGGRFAVLGLRPEEYLVRARIGQEYTGDFPVLLTPRPVAADGQELALVLERASIVVHLLDEEGHAWSGPLADARAVPLLRPTDSGLWPAQPRVLVFECDAREGEPCVAGERLSGKPIDASEYVYEIEGGAHYLVSAVGAGFDGVPRRVEVPGRSGPVVVELRARDPGELGAVLVRVVHGGVELPGGHSGERFGLLLESAGSPAPVLTIDAESNPAPFVFRAPAGSYRVVVEGRASVEFHHGTLTRSRGFARSEAEIELRPGVTRELMLEIAAGARLEVTLEGRAAPADVDVVREGNPWLVEDAKGPRELDAELARRAAQAELHLLTPGRRREPVQRVFVLGGTSAAGKHLVNQWPLGEANVSECLPCGDYTLEARLPGGREARAEVELSPGATTKVTLKF